MRKLLTVKSLVTFAFTLTILLLCAFGVDVPTFLQNLYAIIIGFYFGTQTTKNKE